MVVVVEVKQKERVVAKSYQHLPSLVPAHKKPRVILVEGKHCSFLGKTKVYGIRKGGHGSSSGQRSSLYYWSWSAVICGSYRVDHAPWLTDCGRWCTVSCIAPIVLATSVVYSGNKKSFLKYHQNPHQETWGQFWSLVDRQLCL